MTVTSLKMRCKQKREHADRCGGSNLQVLFSKVDLDVEVESDLLIGVYDRKEFDAFVVGATYSLVLQRIPEDR